MRAEGFSCSACMATRTEFIFVRSTAACSFAAVAAFAAVSASFFSLAASCAGVSLGVSRSKDPYSQEVIQEAT